MYDLHGNDRTLRLEVFPVNCCKKSPHVFVGAIAGTKGATNNVEGFVCYISYGVASLRRGTRKHRFCLFGFNVTYNELIHIMRPAIFYMTSVMTTFDNALM